MNIETACLDHIQAVRRAHGMSITATARAIGMNPGMWRDMELAYTWRAHPKYERDYWPPRRLERLVKVFGPDPFKPQIEAHLPQFGKVQYIVLKQSGGWRLVFNPRKGHPAWGGWWGRRMASREIFILDPQDNRRLVWRDEAKAMLAGDANMADHTPVCEYHTDGIPILRGPAKLPTRVEYPMLQRQELSWV